MYPKWIGAGAASGADVSRRATVQLLQRSSFTESNDKLVADGCSAVCATETGTTYCHAMERQLPVHFELIGCCHPPARVQNDVVELSPETEGGRK